MARAEGRATRWSSRSAQEPLGLRPICPFGCGGTPSRFTFPDVRLVELASHVRAPAPTDRLNSQQESERFNTLNTVTVPTRRVNKVTFVLLCFFLGGFGVDRFMRGQVGLGIFKFLIGSWATLGIWPLVDFIIALVKLGKYQDEFVFDNAGKWVEPAAH